MYTALLIAVNSGSGETFTISRQTKSLSKRGIYRMLKRTAQVASHDDMDTILVFKNDNPSPTVVKFWRAANDDFRSMR